ncbi:MAG TPA: ABC transporter permease [Puia sp.]|nr:ABC transporter permease [Puia sp.]
MLTNYLKSAWRSLWKNKSTSGLNIIGLSVGMTAAVLILLWVRNEMSFDRYHPDADKIFRLTESQNNNQWVWEGTPLPLADAAKKAIPEIDKIARISEGNWPVFNLNNNPVYEKNCAYVDDDWFNIFQYDFIEGNANSFGSNLFSVILTKSEAKKYFGNHDALGATIRIDSTNFVVKAIVGDPPVNSSFQFKAFIPLKVLLLDKDRRENDESWDNNNYVTFVKLKKALNIASVNKKLTSLFPDNKDQSLQIGSIPLKEMHFETDLQSSFVIHGNLNTVYIFTVLGFLLLLIACINYVNLTTAKASLRAKEVSIRKMIGAQRLHLFYQFITESLLISFLALISTMILVQLSLPFFNMITSETFVLPLTSPDLWKVIGTTLAVSVLLNSIYPAILLSAFKPLNVFRGLTVLKVKDVNFRKGLVVLQFTISVILIAASIIIYKQMQYIQKSDPGYNRTQVLSFRLPLTVSQDKKMNLMLNIKQELLKQNGIENVSFANQSIVDIGSMTSGNADWDGRESTFNPKIRQLSTDADYQKTMGLEMKEGRWFQPGTEMDKNNVVLNETAVKELNIHLPVIGQRFTFKGNKGQIIGVVKDFNYQSLRNKTGPLVAYISPFWYQLFMVRIAPGNESAVLHNIQKVLRTFLPDDPFEYNFLDDSFNQLYKGDQQTSSLIFVFALIAVFVSSLGLFGLAAFTAEQRVKEIGIRKTLGASVSGIATLLSKDFVKLVFIAIITGVPIAWWAMNKWIENFASRTLLSWWMFALAGLIAIFIALASVSFQAIKAALANPVTSLRSE